MTCETESRNDQGGGGGGGHTCSRIKNYRRSSLEDLG